MTENQGFSFSERIDVICTECGEKFSTAATHPRSACSERCKRNRNIRASAEYRALGRKLKADLMTRFSGRMPSKDDIASIINPTKRHGKEHE